MRRTDLSLRARLGLKTADFAAFIGVSPSLLSMSEGGFRTLPVPAALKTGSIEMIWQGVHRQVEADAAEGKPILELSPEERQTLCNALRRAMKKLTIQRLRREERLRKMVASFEKHVVAAKVMTALRKPLPTGETLDQEWIDIFERMAQARISPKVQAEIEWLTAQIEAMTLQLARLEARVKQIGG